MESSARMGLGQLPSGAASSLLAGRSAAGRTEDHRIRKAAQEFESVLLGTILSQFEENLHSLGSEENDAAGGSMHGMGVQALGAAWAEAGGIGIGKMIVSALHQPATDRQAEVVSPRDRSLLNSERALTITSQQH